MSKNITIRILLLLLLMRTNQIIHCQETERIIKYFPHTKQISEEYDVLISNEKIKHGYYAKYYQSPKKGTKTDKNDFLWKQGFYKNNEQDSIWTIFNHMNKEHNIISVGKFRNGKKTGIWNTYVEQGNVIKRFDYDENQELEPIFIFTCSYPQKAQEAGIQGKVKIFVKYKKDCKLDTIYVMHSEHEFLDDAALNDVNRTERLKERYSLLHDCSNKADTTYEIIYMMK